MSFFKLIYSFLRQSILIKSFKVLFAFSLLYFAFQLIHYHYYLTTCPYPIMYREGHIMATTVKLLHGVNPYNFVLEPQYSNLYGIVYPLFVLPFANLFGVNLIVHRAITAFFIFATCTVIFLVLYKKKTPLLLNIWAVLVLYASLLFPLTTTPCVDPAATGLFFMLLTIFIPFFLDFSYLSFFFSILCGALAFYCKAYFLLGLPIMVSYLFLFVSKKKSLIFGLSSLIFLLLSAFWMNHYFPSYFDDCFFVNYNISAQSTMMIVLERQLYRFADIHKAIILVIIVASSLLIVRSFKVVRNNGFKDSIKSWFPLFSWNSFEKPLISIRLPLDIFAGVFLGCVLIFSMGRHYGANLWYFFQLFSPFLVIFVAWLVGQISLWPIFFSFLLLYNLFLLSSDDDYKYFDKHVPGWNTMEMLVRSNGNIYNSSLIAPLLIQDNKEIIDDGSAFYPQGGNRNGLLGHFFKEDKRVGEAQAIFANKINDMITNRKFDLVIIEAGYSSDVLPSNLSNYYKLAGSLVVNSPQDRKFYLMKVWRPI